MAGEEITRSAENSQQPVLVLPTDEHRIRQLEAKREEYKERLAAQAAEDPYKHPDLAQSPRGRMKLAILDRLLETGELPIWDFSKEFIALHEGLLILLGPQEFKSQWDDSVYVIESYCTTGGAVLRGGTGLPDTY